MHGKVGCAEESAANADETVERMLLTTSFGPRRMELPYKAKAVNMGESVQRPVGTHGVYQCGKGGVWDTNCLLRGDWKNVVVEEHTIELYLPTTLKDVRDVCTPSAFVLTVDTLRLVRRMEVRAHPR